MYKVAMSKLFEAKCVNFQTPKKYHRVWGKAQHVCTNSAWIPAQSGLSLLCTKVFPVYRVWTQPPLNKFSPCSNNRDIVCRRMNVTYITCTFPLARRRKGSLLRCQCELFFAAVLLLSPRIVFVRPVLARHHTGINHIC